MDELGWDGPEGNEIEKYSSTMFSKSLVVSPPALFLLLCDSHSFPGIITLTVVRGSQFILILA